MQTNIKRNRQRQKKLKTEGETKTEIGDRCTNRFPDKKSLLLCDNFCNFFCDNFDLFFCDTFAACVKHRKKQCRITICSIYKVQSVLVCETKMFKNTGTNQRMISSMQMKGWSCLLPQANYQVLPTILFTTQQKHTI